ncbi:MAG: diacylglycerol kinase family protein [Pirellulaceae bacterium]
MRLEPSDNCAVVSAGGDGTAGALANLLPSHVPLLLFPLGTENLLAKHLGITGDVRQSRTILRSYQRHLLDVGRAGQKLFLVMLSCGFDAEVVAGCTRFAPAILRVGRMRGRFSLRCWATNFHN